MKILNQAKLLALLPLIALVFGCESKEKNVVPKEETIQKAKTEDIITEKKEQKVSVLQQQIELMLAGKKHDEAILKAEVGKQEWKVTFATLKEELAQYTAKQGERPEKKNIAFAHSTLSLIKSEWKLARALEKKKKALDSLENTIKQAIEDENTIKSPR